MIVRILYPLALLWSLSVSIVGLQSTMLKAFAQDTTQVSARPSNIHSKNDTAQAISPDSGIAMPIDADGLQRQASALRNNGQYAEAIKRLKQALALYQQDDNLSEQAEVHTAIALNLESLDQPAIALTHYQRALDLFRSLHIKKWDAQVLNRMGRLQFDRQQYAESFTSFQQALAIAQHNGDRALQVSALLSMGRTLEHLSRFSEVLDTGEQALAIAQDRGDRRSESLAMRRIAIAHFHLAQYTAALDMYEHALAIHYELDDPFLEHLSLHGLGFTYERLGDYEKALDYYQQSLAIYQTVEPSANFSNALQSLGRAYAGLGEAQTALDYFQQALEQAQAAGDRHNAAYATINLAQVYQRLQQCDQTVDFGEQSLVLAQEVGDRNAEGLSISVIGYGQLCLEQYPDAFIAYQHALAIHRQTQNRTRERDTLATLGYVLAQQQQPELAIAFYKQAVNITEAIRQELRVLSTDEQKTYTDTVADMYRRLADLLLQQDRVLEAQRVLDLLKVQELDDYLRGVERTAETDSGVPIRHAEREALALFNANQDKLLLLGQELRELEAIARSDRTAEQSTRIVALRKLQTVTLEQFQNFTQLEEIQSLVAQLRQKTDAANLELREFNALSNNLGALEQNAVILYPLVLEDRLELILVSADAPPLRRTAPVRREELNRAIAQFRSALQSPTENAIAPAQQLYDWLIRPIEPDLAQSHTDTIIYAPDGQLRYVPLAALHDGQQWLTERFQVNNITAASLHELQSSPVQDLSILAAAFVEGQYDVAISDRTLSFDGLAFAGQEINNLEALVPQTETRVDSQFNPDIIYEMNDFSVVHLATHAAFNPGPPEDSFILFGDGSQVTLTDIKGWRLSNVDLIVLSACETALGDVPLGDGKEVLGLGYLMQLAGADAAIASLWRVSDGGTQVLMDAFYGALQQSRMSKAEALRQAQLALITGDFRGLGLDERGAVAIRQRVQETVPQQVSQQLSHPYYWAPFILIGNGL